MRLIDADSIEEVQLGGLIYISPYDYTGMAKYFLDQLKNVPTVDAVEVIRCKDCVHWFGECDDGQEHSCYMDALLRPANHFCGYGKRKED